MEDPIRIGGRGRHEVNLASRKAEEAALRRFQATHWLECVMGPLGISNQPSEQEFITCLRNGLILCNLINKIQPGSVPKVVEKQSSFNSLLWDSQPLPAYQYFENVKNFLVAVEELKLPSFEASIFERENVEEGLSTKVVDCLLALKAYQEWKQMPGSNGVFKPPRSPFVVHSSCRPNSRPQGTTISNSCRQLELSSSEKPPPALPENQKFQDYIVKALTDYMVESKENVDYEHFASLHDGNMDPAKLFREVLSNCVEEQLQKKFPELNPKILKPNMRSSPTGSAFSTPPQNLSAPRNGKWCRACLRNGTCNHWNLVQMHEKEILNLKMILASAKKEFQQLQIQLQRDLQLVGGQVQEMSFAAQKYHKVVEENRNLYNMVQDLKGNIRVYCRIRPLFRVEAKSCIDFVGEDGSLVVADPLKPQKDGRRVFEFNRVFGPSATQEDVFADTRPLIRSVMDGYNVCIFAYGQTGSGKTHTMCGPSGGANDQLGINYLAINDLFHLSVERKNIMKYDIHVQMVEIYNEQVRDLLTEDSSVSKYPFLILNLALPDASMHRVRSTSDVINLMKFGETNRAVGSTAINNRSSRSHSVLTIHVNAEDVSGNRLRSCLHLVDLAGSERVDKSEVTGEGLKEAQYINKSLSSLGDVIMALAQKNSHIPYRNSKLTLLLQNALGGHAKTLMIAHVSPESDSFGETVSTLKFAQRVSTVELGAACANKESSEVLELKAQIESLKKTLADRDAYTPQRNKSKDAARSPITEKKVPKTPPPQRGSRRLSLEGPRLTKTNPEQIKIVEPVQPQGPFVQNTANFEDAESLTSTSHGTIDNGDFAADLNLSNVPRSPTRAALRSPTKPPLKSPTKPALRSPMAKVENRTRIPRLQQTMTPDPTSASKAVGQKGIKTAQGVPSELLIPGLTNTTSNGKGSHIRKSLRTIGKLINGSEKRNQPKFLETGAALSPLNGSMENIFDEEQSPIPSNLKALRRQSLTNMQPPERSRRSSLGGNPIPYTNSTTNEKRNPPTTPPPAVRASTNMTKRWM
ncbi:OLC1v1036765C1 [Oldenlandia corymbosa var. corymbosa]|uniref:OLC1v1036765C1 n=1 Tax=Oldenlandia corymbosa var. corymbosa TaxID=529605 RepID=A0AAV1CW30_OLDCO|nr:OLC1v1036765C1 [Oldenlandia corymbosa var. corymbosa]